jgi:hypothetical protein
MVVLRHHARIIHADSYVVSKEARMMELQQYSYVDNLAASIRKTGEIIIRMIPTMYVVKRRRMWKGRKFCYWG